MPEFKGRLRTPRLAAAPSSPVVGEMYYDTVTNLLYFWNGTVWTAGGAVDVFEQTGDPGAAAGVGDIWIDTDAPQVTWSGIPLVSSLPVGPLDGQEIYYLADAGNGGIWHLRYRAASPNPHKWEFLGGSALESGPGGGMTLTTATTWTDFTAHTPLTVPLAGVYRLAAQDFRQSLAFTAAYDTNLRIYASSPAGALVGAGKFVVTAVYAGANTRLQTYGTLDAGAVVKLQVHQALATQTSYGDGLLSIIPVRVG